MEEDKDLRDGLDALTQSMFPTTYEHRWRLIEQYGGHRLKRLTDGLPNNRYNCFSYALGIYARPDYQQLADETAERERALVSAAFVEHLVAQGMAAMCAADQMRAGDVLLYSNDVKLQHAALVVTSDGLCRSKWGPAELYEHGRWEVPSSYGRSLKVIRLTASPDAIMAELRRWVDAGN